MREILVLPPDILRHVDVFDLRIEAERPKQRRDQIAKAAGLAGADVEDARDLRRFHQPSHHRDGVIDVDEVAPLVAILDAWPVRLEQPHGAAVLRIVETLGDEAHHLALVVLVRAEHVEELQARPLRRQLFLLHEAFGHGLVEQLLAPAVEIHRPELLQARRRPVVAEAFGAVAVGCRRRGIDERHPRAGTPVQKPHRAAEVVLHHQVGVGRGGVGDRAHVDDGVELAAIEPLEQVVRGQDIRYSPLPEVEPLLLGAEHVVHDDVGPPGLVEGRDHIRADESGPACDQEHPRPAAVRFGQTFAPDRRGTQLGSPASEMMLNGKNRVSGLVPGLDSPIRAGYRLRVDHKK